MLELEVTRTWAAMPGTGSTAWPRWSTRKRGEPTELRPAAKHLRASEVAARQAGIRALGTNVSMVTFLGDAPTAWLSVANKSWSSVRRQTDATP
jgi:hypothetical protein